MKEDKVDIDIREGYMELNRNKSIKKEIRRIKFDEGVKKKKLMEKK